jgi:hypothetical protein
VVKPDNTTITVDGTGALSVVGGGGAGSFLFLNHTPNPNGTITTFTMSSGGTPYSPSPVGNLLVFVGGVPQVATANYNVAGSNITFSTAPATGASIILVTIA